MNAPLDSGSKVPPERHRLVRRKMIDNKVSGIFGGKVDATEEKASILSLTYYRNHAHSSFWRDTNGVVMFRDSQSNEWVPGEVLDSDLEYNERTKRIFKCSREEAEPIYFRSQCHAHQLPWSGCPTCNEWFDRMATVYTGMALIPDHTGRIYGWNHRSPVFALGTRDLPREKSITREYVQILRSFLGRAITPPLLAQMTEQTRSFARELISGCGYRIDLDWLGWESHHSIVTPNLISGLFHEFIAKRTGVSFDRVDRMD